MRHVDAFRLAGKQRASCPAAQTFGCALKLAAFHKTPIVVQIESRGVVQMHAGVVSNVSRSGSWLNVIDATFNFHFVQGGARGDLSGKQAYAQGTSSGTRSSRHHGQFRCINLRHPTVRIRRQGMVRDRETLLEGRVSAPPIERNC